MLHNRTERRFGFALIVLGLCLSSLAWAQKPAASKSASVLATAKSQLGRGDLESAESNLWSVLGSEPTNEQALAMLGMVRGRQQRYAEAEALILRAQGSPGTALELAHVFVEAKDPAGAQKALSLVNPVPKALAAQVYYLKGRALRQTGNVAGATASFRQALTMDPKSVEALVALAEVYSAASKHADSVLMLEKARDLNPDSRAVLRPFLFEANQ